MEATAPFGEEERRQKRECGESLPGKLQKGHWDEL
jgi:hypothetical protein